MSNLESEKALAAARAIEEVADGMVVGLGTGSTASYVVRGLGLRVADGLKITATATSSATEALASSHGIPLTPFTRLSRIDLTIDGADEIDSQFRAIKGGGGALFREKVVATASDRVVIAVDSSKPVKHLGRFPLPVEVIPFASAFAERSLKQFDVPVTMRMKPDGTPFITDQGAYIYDLAFGRIDDPGEIAHRLRSIPGILEHGLFLSEIDCVYVGKIDHVEAMQRANPTRSKPDQTRA
ncbi:MAG TPA: ribose-5-phosphate isomerase RpiA [Phycisphaerales bacterium]|nr:ribose-5-phosphate isomerase RpiA [Phycisphaerales bacterium]